MTHSIETICAIGSALLLVSVVASRVSSRFGIPSLILFIAIGMLAGSDGPGGIYFDDNLLGRELGTVALALILFSGGLDTHWHAIRPVILPGLSLATFGTAITASLVGVFAHVFLGFSMIEGLLLGAVVSPTDAAAVFGVLRARSLKLKNSLGPLLEFESGSNDPTAVFLTIAITGLILKPGQSLWLLAGDFAVQMLIGGAFGYFLGRTGTWLINRIHLDFDGLYPALTLALAFASFGGAGLVGGNGFLAVYVTGVTLGNSVFVHRISLLQFHDGLAWLMQIAMFLTLGLLAFPSHLPAVAISGTALAIFSILVARPAAIFVALSLSRRFSVADKAFLSWMGLRGAVPIILATFPLTAGVANAHLIFNVVFFVVLLSVLIQGTTAVGLAKMLNVVELEQTNMIERRVVSSKLEVTIPEDSRAVGRRIVNLGLPPTALIVLITRGSETLIPRGNTKIEAGDVMLISSPGSAESELRRVLLGDGQDPDPSESV